MPVNKITVGYVVQTYNTDTHTFEAQEFVAGDQVEYEDEAGETVAPFDDYLPFDMTQPSN